MGPSRGQRFDSASRAPLSFCPATTRPLLAPCPTIVRISIMARHAARPPRRWHAHELLLAGACAVAAAVAVVLLSRSALLQLLLVAVVPVLGPGLVVRLRFWIFTRLNGEVGALASLLFARTARWLSRGGGAFVCIFRAFCADRGDSMII